MSQLIVDFITSLDGYASAEGWPGWWGLQGPEYLAWLDEQPERDYTILMGANTYRLMYGFASESEASESAKATDEDAAMAELTTKALSTILGTRNCFITRSPHFCVSPTRTIPCGLLQTLISAMREIAIAGRVVECCASTREHRHRKFIF